MSDGDAPGPQTITPYFTVEDADGFIAFATSVFGARVVKEDRDVDSRIQHARLRIGTSLIMLNQGSEAYAPNTSQMHIIVDDADAAHQLALRYGATTLMTPNDRPHGERMAGVRDPFGNTWWMAHPLAG